MSDERCARSWEAEALEDGRLRDSDRDSFERHAAGCEACRVERARLRALGEAMEALPNETMTPLDRHRLRAQLLRRANDLVAGPPRPARLRAYALAFAALGAIGAIGIAVALWVAVVGRSPRAPVAGAPPSSGAPAAEPRFRIDAPAGHVTKRQGGPTTIVALDDGTAAFAVEHLDAAQQFIVALPDGEIHVRGTRFEVEVREATTRRVTVTEGRVVFRRQDAPEVILSAGEAWPSPLAAASALDPPIDSAPVPPAGSASGASASAASAHASASSAGAAFAEAMRLFGEGSYTDADAQLAAFLRDHPHDPRAEDAAFLRAVAHARSGDRDGAAALAASYLQRYPSGLRRAEAQRIVDAAAP